MDNYYSYKDIDFADFVGKVINKVELDDDEQVLTFTCDNGEEIAMLHFQDCCEDVFLEDVEGDFDDIIGTEVVTAYETSHQGCDGKMDGDHDEDSFVAALKGLDFSGESCTWTFYHIATNRGSVVLRWYGSSNGYYSESVCTVITKAASG